MRDTTLHRQEPTRALTVGEIAARLGQPVHRIEYIIDSRGLRPTAWAGHARIFSEADVTYIEQVLRRIAAERQGDRHD
jgi:hypothetical protein